MKIKRKVTIEMDSIKITVPNRAVGPTWCEICQSEAEFIEPNDAARLVMALANQGVAVVEEGLHFYSPAYSQQLICLNSLINQNK